MDYWKFLPRLSGVLCAMLLPLTAQAEVYHGLPPPPGVNAAGQPQRYMLDLQLNGREQGQIVPVIIRNGRYILRAGDLERAGFPSAKITASEIDLAAIPQVKADYDAARQRLLVQVPPEWLPPQTISADASRPRFPARVSNGALLNYDLYTSHTDAAGARFFFWHELRLFGSGGQFINNGLWHQPLSGSRDVPVRDYIRYDSYWINQDEDRVLSWRAGDLITDSLGWNNSVRLGGLQISRDFSVRPDIITWPLPSFSGQAAVPSTVDLFVNGYQHSSTAVQPGPFSLTNLPFVNGAGNAVIVTTDALGRQVTTTLPFYVASSLLKPGLYDYAFSAGALRENYGKENFDYGETVASGSLRYGLTDWLTLEGHAEGAQSLGLAGIGAQMRIGAFGELNGNSAQSQISGTRGQQYGWGYRYNNAWFSLGIQQILRSSDYGDLALYSSRQASRGSSGGFMPSRRSRTINGSLALNEYGSLGAALIDVTSGRGDKTRLLNLSWSKNLWGDSTLYLAASRDQQRGDWSGALSLIVPFGDLGNISASLERNQDGGYARRLWASRAMPSDGGFAWDASWARQPHSSDYRQASLRWGNAHLEASGGYYGDGEDATSWGELAGSLLFMDNHSFAARQVSDAFVLVKTGYPDITVRYENQDMGKTDANGYLPVARINAWYPARYEIDTLNLPVNMTVEQTEQRFSVKRQSGYLLNFMVEPLRAASVILHNEQGEPLPVSSRILRPLHATAYVGWDGLVWLEHLETSNPFQAVLPDGSRCQGDFRLQDNHPQSLTAYGPLICRAQPNPETSP